MEPKLNALFVIFHGFAEEYNGISKKIKYQQEALVSCGVPTQLCYDTKNEDGRQYRLIDGKVIRSFGKGIKAKIDKRISYRDITVYIRDNKINLVYLRYNHNASPFLIYWFKQIKKLGVHIYLEIPTWPYDSEYSQFSFKEKLPWFIDRLFRKKLMKKVDKIVTFSHVDTIFNRPTLKISNGIDFSKIPLRKPMNLSQTQMRCVAVAEIHFWHGYDRMIAGMAEYYSELKRNGVVVGSTENHPKITFEIAGEGFASEKMRLEALVRDLNLGNYVRFLGNVSGSELDNLFDKSDLGIASLGRHRSGIKFIKTLKNREYAARGLSFVYSETDEDFENSFYILKVLADESSINMHDLIRFWQEQKNTDINSIRTDVNPRLSWQTQMQRVINDIKLI